MCGVNLCNLCLVSVITELIRTVHLYRLESAEEEVVEREYVFHTETDYEEINFCKVLILQKIKVSSHFKGRTNGVWSGFVFLFSIRIVGLLEILIGCLRLSQ